VPAVWSPFATPGRNHRTGAQAQAIEWIHTERISQGLAANPLDDRVVTAGRAHDADRDYGGAFVVVYARPG